MYFYKKLLFFLACSTIFIVDAAEQEKEVVIRVIPYLFQEDGTTVFLKKEQVAPVLWKDFVVNEQDYDALAQRLTKETKGLFSFNSYNFSKEPDIFFEGEKTKGKVYFIDISDQVKIKKDFVYDENSFVLIPVLDLLKASQKHIYKGVPVSRGVIKLLTDNWEKFIQSKQEKQRQEYQQKLFSYELFLNKLIPSRGLFPQEMKEEAMPEAIFFYKKDSPYYEFTNFYPAEIFIDGYIYPTTEHYFQAQKFIHHPEVMALIRESKNPRGAYEVAARYRQNKRKDWDEVSILVMFKALVSKFVQHPDLLRILLKTGDKLIVENTALVGRSGHDDPFWGNGKEFSGENYLGRLLMALRSLIRENPPPFFVMPQEDLLENPVPEAQGRIKGILKLFGF